jgi:hypothetical protein
MVKNTWSYTSSLPFVGALGQVHYVTSKVTNFMELSPSWEAVSCAATQELPSILWNPKVHYRVHMSPSVLYPEPDRSSPYHLHPVSLRSILILSTHLRLSLPSSLFLSGSPTNILYSFLFSPIRTTWHAHLILFHLIILIMLGEEYKLRSSSLCSYLQLTLRDFNNTSNSVQFLFVYVQI